MKITGPTMTFALAGLLATAAGATSVHTNNFSIVGDGETVTTMSFTPAPGSFVISSGQPSGEPPVTASFTANNTTLNVVAYAGHHGTSQIAQDFEQMAGTYIVNAQTKPGQKPGKLNFAFRGTLVIGSDSFQNVVIAQGGGFATNNWWVGVEGVSSVGFSNGHSNLCLKGANATYQLTFTGSHEMKAQTVSGAQSCGSAKPTS